MNRGRLSLAIMVTGVCVLVSSCHGTGVTWLPPSLEHPLGTDEFGRDLLTATLLATFFSTAKGIGLATVAFGTACVVAYLTVIRKSLWLNWLLRGLTQLVESIPILLWVLTAVVAIADPRWLVVTVAFTIAALPPVTTVIAGELERLRDRPYVEAARLLGVGELRILAQYVAPNAVFVLAPLAVQVLGAAIAVDGAIGVLGMGNRSDHDLGVLLLRGKENFVTHPEVLGLGLGMFVLLYSCLGIAIWRLQRRAIET